jgi:hypothetical protein
MEELKISKETAQLGIAAVISRLFLELATKHNVKVDDLNLHISCKTLYIQKYTPNSKNEYECLEMVDLNALTFH